jgi:uncharacterized protein (TIGR03066 family)
MNSTYFQADKTPFLRTPAVASTVCVTDDSLTAEDQQLKSARYRYFGSAVPMYMSSTRIRLSVALFISLVVQFVGVATGQVERSLGQRVETRRFPSVFQAWNSAQNVQDESPLHTIARHDLVWHGPEFFRLRWNETHVGLADGFDAESVKNAKAFRQRLLGLNPNLILTVEIRYRDAHKSYLPEAHSWWLRDKQGRIVPGWEEGGYLCLDFHNPEFRRHVAKQAKAAIASGAVDGIMLDWWSDDASRLALVKEVRQSIGDHALIISNANERKTPQTAPYINGYFMECVRSSTAEDWRRIADTLTWAEKNLRSPRVNCVETWFHKSRNDVHLMRATTTLALTHSNGYCLFSDPNPLPTPDHLHNWYPFWDKCLGRPVSEKTAAADGSFRREFDGGTVAYNPMGNRSVTVAFPQPRISVATGQTAREHQLASPDGDIYLVSKFPPSAATSQVSQLNDAFSTGQRDDRQAGSRAGSKMAKSKQAFDTDKPQARSAKPSSTDLPPAMLGKWELKKPNGQSQLVVEFRRDGTMAVTYAARGKTAAGSWRLQDRRIHFNVPGIDGVAPANKDWCEIVAIDKDSMTVLMTGKDRQTWKRPN